MGADGLTIIFARSPTPEELQRVLSNLKGPYRMRPLMNLRAPQARDFKVVRLEYREGWSPSELEVNRVRTDQLVEKVVEGPLGPG